MTLGVAGYATRYNEIIVKGGEAKLFLPGAFSSTFNLSAKVSLLRDHFDDEYIGSTDDILTIYDDGNTGLAFFISNFPDTRLGKHLRYMSVDAGFDSVSIGFQWDKTDSVKRTIDGTEVTCIATAALGEISIMSGYDNGACRQSFAVYGDFDSLEDECRCGRLLREGAAVQFRRAVRRYQICEGAKLH